MAKYIDGYVLPIQKNKLSEYKRMAQKAGKLWIKYGALAYFETVGEDLNPKFAGIKFPKTVNSKPGETVVFSFVIFKSRKHRDQVNEKVIKDPMMNEYKDIPMPFDMKRMVYGGFDVIVDL